MCCCSLMFFKKKTKKHLQLQLIIYKVEGIMNKQNRLMLSRQERTICKVYFGHQKCNVNHKVILGPLEQFMLWESKLQVVILFGVWTNRRKYISPNGHFTGIEFFKLDVSPELILHVFYDVTSCILQGFPY